MDNFDYLELQILETHKEIFEKYNIYIDTEAINIIKEKVLNREYVVSVVGTMKAGKSTFINSILGEELMPNENAACTLTTTEIIDDKNTVTLIKKYDDGSLEELIGENITQVFHDEVRKTRKEKVLKNFKYILRKNIKAIEEDSVDIGFKIVDTPGYNEMSGLGVERSKIEKIFEKQIKKTDYVIYVLDYKYYKSEENIEILKKIKAIRGDIFENENIMFILNKVDLITYKDGDITEIVQDVERLIKTTGIENPGILPFSAKKAFLYKVLEENKNIELYESEFDTFNKLREKTINGQRCMVKESNESLKDSLCEESNISIFEEKVLKVLFKEREDLLIQSLNGQKKTVIDKFLRNSKSDIQEIADDWIAKKKKRLEEEERNNCILELKEKALKSLKEIDKALCIEKKEKIREKIFLEETYVESEYLYPYCEFEEYYSSSYSAEQNGKTKFRNWKGTIKPRFLDIYRYYNELLNSKNSSCNKFKMKVQVELEKLEKIMKDLEKLCGKCIYINTKINIQQKQIMNLSYDNSDIFLADGYDNSTFVSYDTDETYVDGLFGGKWKTVYVYELNKAVEEEEKDVQKAQLKCSEKFFEDFYLKYSQFKKEVAKIVKDECKKVRDFMEEFKLEREEESKEKIEEEEKNIVVIGTIYNQLENYLQGENING